MARGQAELLAPMVQTMMREAEIGFDQLDRIAVTRGPGAFTGLRVGLAFSRGLALALNKPCIGISTLEVLAVGASQHRTLAVIAVAGSLFVGGWEGRQETIAPCQTELAALLGQLHGDWAVTGPGAASILPARPDWLHIHQDLPDPIILAQMASHVDPADYPPAPLYLRGVEAKLPGGVLVPDTAT